MTAGRLFGPALTLLLVALAWAVWDRGGILLAALGLDLLDVPGRVCLAFAALGVAEAVLARLPPAIRRVLAGDAGG
jgi:hypothetical protein